jgi:hypothetical protein
VHGRESLPAFDAKGFFGTRAIRPRNTLMLFAAIDFVISQYSVSRITDGWRMEYRAIFAMFENADDLHHRV